MQVTRSRTRIALLSLVLMAAGPTATPTEIPWAPGDEEALIVPAGSPVRFIRFDKEHVARFRGRFVLTGTFIYGCDIECEPPITKQDINSSIVPDAAFAARLPHWKIRTTDMRLYLTGGDRLAAQIVTPAERAAIFAGRVDSVRKHVSIIVDDFNATIECDSASYGARFVALAKPARIASAKLDGDYGCGWI